MAQQQREFYTFTCNNNKCKGSPWRVYISAEILTSGVACPVCHKPVPRIVEHVQDTRQTMYDAIDFDEDLPYWAKRSRQNNDDIDENKKRMKQMKKDSSEKKHFGN